MTVVLDDKGRIIIPKKIREKMNLSSGTRFTVKVEGDVIILKKVESVAERFAGKFKAKKPIPEDLDGFINKVIQDWWKEST